MLIYIQTDNHLVICEKQYVLFTSSIKYFSSAAPISSSLDSLLLQAWLLVSQMYCQRNLYNSTTGSTCPSYKLWTHSTTVGVFFSKQEKGSDRSFKAMCKPLPPQWSSCHNWKSTTAWQKTLWKTDVNIQANLVNSISLMIDQVVS